MNAGSGHEPGEHGMRYPRINSAQLSPRLRALGLMSMALKEANETDYWLFLLRDTEFIRESHFESLQPDCSELVAMLVSTVKISKRK